MSEQPVHRSKASTVASWLVLFVVLGVLVAVAIPTWQVIEEMARVESLMNRLRQIKMELDIWAGDHSGKYPDSVYGFTTSNQVFRQLIRDEVIADEHLFEGMKSPFMADGNLGTAPEYADACGPGENHWMMLKGANQRDQPQVPFLFENALNASWPPKWRADSDMEPVRGRTWLSGRLVICLLDGSINLEKLSKQGDVWILPDRMMTRLSVRGSESIEILDIEEKK